MTAAQQPSAPAAGTISSRSTTAVTYEARRTTKVDLVGTPLMPRARGEAEIETEASGPVRIKAKVRDVTPPAPLGPEYLTYVLWAVPPQGRAKNLGELRLDDGAAEIEATADVQTFALIVTAEPYYAVTTPSDVVVMENAVRQETRGRTSVATLHYEIVPRGAYIAGEASATRRRGPDKRRAAGRAAGAQRRRDRADRAGGPLRARRAGDGAAAAGAGRAARGARRIEARHRVAGARVGAGGRGGAAAVGRPAPGRGTGGGTGGGGRAGTGGARRRRRRSWRRARPRCETANAPRRRHGTPCGSASRPSRRRRTPRESRSAPSRHAVKPSACGPRRRHRRARRRRCAPRPNRSRPRCAPRCCSSSAPSSTRATPRAD